MKIYKLLNISFFYNFQFIDLYCKSINKLFNILGYKFKHGKLVKMTLKPKEEKNLIHSHEQKLDLNYHFSSRAKSLYEEIN